MSLLFDALKRADTVRNKRDAESGSEPADESVVHKLTTTADEIDTVVSPEDVEQLIEELSAQIVELDQRNSVLEEKFNGLNKVKAQLDVELWAATTKLKDQDAKQQLAAIEQARALESATQAALALEEQNQSLQSRIATLEGQNAEQRKRNGEMEELLADVRLELEHRNTEHQKAMALSSEQLESASRNCQQLTDELQELRRLNSELDGGRELDRRRVDELSAELLAMRQHNADLEEQRLALEQDRNALEQQLQAQRADLQDDNSGLVRQLDEKTRALAEAGQQYRSLSDSHEELAASLASLEQQLADSTQGQEQLVALQEQVGALQRQLEEQQQTHAEALASRDYELEIAAHRLTEQRNAVAELESLVADRHDEVEALQRQLADAQARIDALQAEREATPEPVVETGQALHLELETLRSDNAALRAQLQSAGESTGSAADVQLPPVRGRRAVYAYITLALLVLLVADGYFRAGQTDRPAAVLGSREPAADSAPAVDNGIESVPRDELNTVRQQLQQVRFALTRSEASVARLTRELELQEAARVAASLRNGNGANAAELAQRPVGGEAGVALQFENRLRSWSRPGIR